MSKKTRENRGSTYIDYRSHWRYRLHFQILRPILRQVIKFLFRYEAVPYPNLKKDTFVILSNHTGALDPIFLASSFKDPIFFLASDHIFRNRFLRNLLRYLVAPIPFSKTALDLSSLREIKSIIDHGHHIAFFPSGNRSVSGPEEAIPRATSKLLKLLAKDVLLYRIEGGYLSSPRWARFSRKGKMAGKVVLKLAAEEIKSLSTKEIDELLQEYLDANPYQEKTQNTIPYKGKRLAEYLERILWICPACKGICTTYSDDDRFTCTCEGFGLCYKENGYFSKLETKKSGRDWSETFPHVDAYYQWQSQEITALFSKESLALTDNQLALLSDMGEAIYQVHKAKNNAFLFNGSLSLYKDCIVLSSSDDEKQRAIEITLENIANISCIGPQRLQFSDKRDNTVYECINKAPRSAYKYIQLIEHLQKLHKNKSVIDLV